MYIKDNMTSSKIRRQNGLRPGKLLWQRGGKAKIINHKYQARPVEHLPYLFRFTP